MTWRRAVVAATIAVVAVVGYLVATAAESPSQRSAPSKVVIEAVDLSPEEARLRAPARIDAGLVEIVLRNRGDIPHDAQLFRVDGDRTSTDVIEVLEAIDSAPKPRWLRPAGGVAPIAPGESARVTQVLEPGRYVVADTQERFDPIARTTNAAKGGVAEIEVEGETGDAQLPVTEATIAAREYGFETAGLGAGATRVRFRNDGRQAHQVVAFRVADGVPFAAGARTIERRRSLTGWVPVDVPDERATTVLDGGGEQIAELDFDPGRYLLLCFVSDRHGSGPQWTLGMRGRLDVPPAGPAPRP